MTDDHTPSSTSSPDTADSRSPSSPSWPTPRIRGLIGGTASKQMMQAAVEAGLPLAEAEAMAGLRLSAPSASPKSTPMPAPSSPTAGPMSPTSAPFSQSPEIASLRSAVSCRLSSLVGFLASRTPSPASAEPSSTPATSGMSASECFGMYDPALPSSRTLRDSSPPVAIPMPRMVSSAQDFFSTAYVATWPRFGTLVNGRLYRQPTLARPTSVIESGSSASMNWPTATASDTHTDRLASTQQKDGSMHSVTLPQAVTRDWPTATARDSKGPSARAYKGHPENLADVVVDWPTPTASEGSKIPSSANYGQIGLSNHPAIVGEPTRPKGKKSRSGPPRTASGPHVPASDSTGGSRRESWATPTGDDANNATRESGAFQSLTRQAGKLNPSWVETLMGLPMGHTQLPQKFVKPKQGKK